MVSRRTFVRLATASGTLLLAPPRLGPKALAKTESTQSGYAAVHGLDMYYEVHGSGEPVVLIHGAFETIQSWSPMLTALAANRQVIAPELQGHGHTGDIERPFRYEQLADDVAELLAHLKTPQADVIGYSMGANTALQLAIRHPDRVRRLVTLAANYRSEGEYPEVHEGIRMLSPEVFAGTPVMDNYLQVAPRPDDFPVLVEKLKTFLASEFAFPDTDVQTISAPTLVVVGDSDTVRPEHAVTMFRLVGGGVPGDLAGLPDSQLAILPGTTHAMLVSASSDLMLARINTFLTSPMPENA